jgi:aryl-alcohol dehydrogenase-like predicted oxidoreductase
MDKRRFGRTGHMSTVAIFGAAALSSVDQKTADLAVETILEFGVNHIDVAPSYGEAEARLAPWMPQLRDQFFVGCKTMERKKDDARDEMQRSLERLKMTSFDLYQIHAVTTLADLDEVTRKGGALEALIAAREEGLTRYLGITGHGIDSPAVFIEALRRFDFDSVLFPLNFVQFANPAYRRDAEELIRLCHERDVATMVIKSITKGPWGEQEQRYDCWYEPFDTLVEIQEAVNFALSQDVSGLCTAGDTRLLPLVLQACVDFQPMPAAEQAQMVAEGEKYDPLFA